MGLNFKRWKLIGIAPYVTCPLYASITTVNDNIGTCGVCASITCKVQVDTLQFPWISVSSHWSVSEPGFFHLKRTICTDRSINVPRANTVDSCEVDKFHGKGFCEMDDSSLASIIAGLV
jgi:hypothetical protein